MNWTKLSGFAMAAALIAVPATARADSVPTTDEVVAIMAELTDPNKPAADKGNIVTPGFAPDEAGTIDDHLRRMDGQSLPLTFIVSDVQPAPDNFAGATVATTGGNFHQWGRPGSVVLVNQGGHWMLTHNSAMRALDAYWYNANRKFHPGLLQPQP
jgi:hypothetical protein